MVLLFRRSHQRDGSNLIVSCIVLMRLSSTGHPANSIAGSAYRREPEPGVSPGAVQSDRNACSVTVDPIATSEPSAASHSVSCINRLLSFRQNSTAHRSLGLHSVRRNSRHTQLSRYGVKRDKPPAPLTGCRSQIWFACFCLSAPYAVVRRLSVCLSRSSSGSQTIVVFP